MIKAHPKPHKKVEYYTLTAQLDTEYTIEVSKTTNGSTIYDVVSIEPSVSEPLQGFITATVLNYCNREGLGQIENK